MKAKHLSLMDTFHYSWSFYSLKCNAQSYMAIKWWSPDLNHAATIHLQSPCKRLSDIGIYIGHSLLLSIKTSGPKVDKTRHAGPLWHAAFKNKPFFFFFDLLHVTSSPLIYVLRVHVTWYLVSSLCIWMLSVSGNLLRCSILFIFSWHF